MRLSELVAPAFFDVWRDIRSGGHDAYWLAGGRGSAKSSFASLAIVSGLLRDAQANAIVYRKVAATLRDSVYEQLIWAIDRMGLRPWATFRLSPLEIRLKSGQRILFRGADDPAKSKSLKLSKGYFKFLWFEELSEFPSLEAVNTIRASVIRGGRTLTICSYNPPVTMDAWVNEEAARDVPGRLVHYSDYRGVPPEWLGEAFLRAAEALKQTNERMYRHMYLGEITGTGAQVFENLTIRPIEPGEIMAFGHTCAGLDWGWYPDPLHFVSCAWDPERRRLWIYDEYRASRLDNAALCAVLTEEKGLTREEEVIADSSEPKSIRDLRSFGLRCTGAVKGPGSVRASMKWLQGLAEIVIDPNRCPFSAREFRLYEYERGRDGRIADAFPDRDNHAIDAVRYATNRIWLRAGA